MFTYTVLEEYLSSDELGSYRSYGICVKNEAGEIMLSVSDISTDARVVLNLAERCTRGALSPEQLLDVILDCIQEAALP